MSNPDPTATGVPADTAWTRSGWRRSNPVAGRALDLPRPLPEHRLVAVLTFSLRAPTLPSKGNAKGLKLVATDVDWAAGAGREVTGPGEALLMAAAGRPCALDDLTGEGLSTLRHRVDRA